MGKRRFSLTTLILVGISLAAIYYVGKTVTPPPPGPPQEKPEPAAAPDKNAPVAPAPKDSTMDAEAQRAKDRTQQIKRMMATSKRNAGIGGKAFNPAAIDTTADYWQNYHMGQKGAQEMREKVAKALAAPQPPPGKPTASPILPGP